MTIFYIALIVCAVAFVSWLLAVLIDGRRLRGMRGRLYPSPLKRGEVWDRPVSMGDDDTKTWPPGGGK